MSAVTAQIESQAFTPALSFPLMQDVEFLPVLSQYEMAPQEITLDVLSEKYAKDGETSVDEIHARVARALASVETDSRRLAVESDFLWALRSGFVPAGRIASAAGTDIKATLINCFVQPIADSMSGTVNGRPGIYTALQEAAETMRRGGGVGYNFSHIRPKGALVKGTHSDASGPISYMKVYDESCSTIVSAGSRRGAQMGVLRCDHPDIAEFIRAKSGGKLTNFNLSIGVTDEFMRAVCSDSTFDLVHECEPCIKGRESRQREDGKWIYDTVRATDLWEKVMRSTYDFAEPGILFLDRINKENNLHYCEIIEAMNPCGEQALPSYGCCCLGSFNLTRFVSKAFTKVSTFDFDAFRSVIRIGVRMLDNVLDATLWPLEQQRIEAMNKRRIGLGFLGLGSALVMLGLRYDSEEGRELAAKISRVMRDESYRASIALAQEKGAFPLLDAEQYLASGFASRLPDDIKVDIRAHGIRNSHLLSIAPTGTITLAFADNASNGIEPAFSWTYNRKKRMADGSSQQYEVADHAWRMYRDMGGDMDNLPASFVTALEMSAENHMKMMQVVQPFIDSAISKTVNVPADYPYADFQDLYMQAWKAGLKGMATYRPNDVLGAVLSVTPVAEPAPAPVSEDAKTIADLQAAVASMAAQVADSDPLQVSIDKRPEGDLEGVTSKVVYWTTEGKQSLYLTVNFARVSGVVKGVRTEIERPIEFFIPSSQVGNGQQWIASNMMLMSLNARSGGSVAKSLRKMREVVWDKGTVRCGTYEKQDGAKVPRFHDSDVAAIGYAIQQILYKRGFLDIDGNQVPTKVLAKNLAARTIGEELDEVEVIEAAHVAPEAAQIAESVSPSVAPAMGTGRKCPECGGHSLHKRDGCSVCVSCGYVGSCG